MGTAYCGWTKSCTTSETLVSDDSPVRPTKVMVSTRVSFRGAERISSISRWLACEEEQKVLDALEKAKLRDRKRAGAGPSAVQWGRLRPPAVWSKARRPEGAGTWQRTVPFFFFFLVRTLVY